MKNLSNSVLEYYLSHIEQLSSDKQFHFYSRLHLYCQLPQTTTGLAGLKDYFTNSGHPEAAIAELVRDARERPSHGSKNASHLREPYFKKYPDLKPAVSALFRANFLRTIYDIDVRDEVVTQIGTEKLEALYTNLMQDAPAIAMLSTHAINFFYLYRMQLLQDDDALSPEVFLRIGQEAYDITDKLHVQLLIYLFTHCIIGDTLFYYRPVLPRNNKVYHQMLAHLESLIADNYDSINLDNKFEFLACCRIIDYPTQLRNRIFEEADKSISPHGQFVIDVHNTNKQTANVTLSSSEHRNVLLIMADHPYTPSGS